MTNLFNNSEGIVIYDELIGQGMVIVNVKYNKFDNNKKSNPKEAKFRSPKRLRGKSRTHFKNRELDDIFKNRNR